jgi:putative phosphoesterase
MKIGIISDTHGYLPPAVFKIFEKVDSILHAGDIGSNDIIDELEMLAPVYAVSGNIDSWPIVSQFSPTLVTEFNDLTFYLIHHIISEKFVRYELFRKKIKPHVLVYGHTHIPNVSLHNEILFINPGSVSKPRKGKKGSVILLDVSVRPLKPQLHYVPL